MSNETSPYAFRIDPNFSLKMTLSFISYSSVLITASAYDTKLVDFVLAECIAASNSSIVAKCKGSETEVADKFVGSSLSRSLTINSFEQEIKVTAHSAKVKILLIIDNFKGIRYVM